MAGVSAERPNLLRNGSARFLACGALVCAALFTARLHVLSALAALVIVSIAGALRRFQQQASGSILVQPKALFSESHSPAGSPLADLKTLESRLVAEWQREQKPSEPTSLLLIELDAFEHLGEQGGPLAGNVAMLTVAGALSRMLPREADLLARYNERTFAVLLSGTDLPGSLRVAARLRWAIVRLGIVNTQTASGFLSACMGVSVRHGLAAGGAMGLLVAAERALGAAREAGHDSLEYLVLSEEPRTVPLVPPSIVPLPSIRAWTPERSSMLHSPLHSPPA